MTAVITMTESKAKTAGLDFVALLIIVGS